MLDASQEQWLAVIRSEPWTAEVYVARLATTASDKLRFEASIDLAVSPTTSIHALKQSLQQGDGYLSWSGCLDNGACMVNLVLTDKGITGSVNTGTTLYDFSPISGGLEALRRIDPTKYPPPD